MNANNVYDYLIPVGEAGDKLFTNGQQDKVVTKDEERKAEELIKQIALKKQLDLERGNAEHIRKMLEEDTPEAAIYRAMLLSEQEKLQKLNNDALKKKDEGKKSGVVRRVAGFVGKTALNTAKYMGYTALQFLALKALFNAGAIARDGPMKTWKRWQTEAGVARTPDLAEKFGDTTAALGDDIVKRSVSIASMTPEQQAAAITYADKIAGKAVNTAKARFDLMSVFKDKDSGEYFDNLPKNADPSKFLKEYGFFLRTGEKGDTPIPVNKTELGTNMFNSIFKVGNVDALITPENNWFTGNPHIRSIDNQVWRLGRMTGYNEKGRLNSAYARPYHSEDVGSKLECAEKADYSSRVLKDKEKNTGDLIDSLVEHTHSTGMFKDPHFKVTPKNVMKILNKLDTKEMNDELEAELFDDMEVNYKEGILPSNMNSFFRRAIKLKNEYKNPADRGKLNRKLKELIDYYWDTDIVLWGARDPYHSKEGKGNPAKIQTGTFNTVFVPTAATAAGAVLKYVLLPLIFGVGYRFPTKKRTKQKQTRRTHRLRKRKH